MPDVRYLLAHCPDGQKGQDLTEYALLLTLIALICVLAVTTVGTVYSSFWDDFVTSIVALF